MENQERRRADRREFRMQVVFRDDLNLNMAASLNVSESGLLVSSDVSLDPGTHIALFPLLDEMDPELYKLDGEVVRSCEDIMVSPYADDRFHMGIRLDLTEKQTEALRQFLGKN